MASPTAVAPAQQAMGPADGLDLFPGEAQVFFSCATTETRGKAVRVVLTDRRLIIREHDHAFQTFTLTALSCFFIEAETDNSYALIDLKRVAPFESTGCDACCIGTMNCITAPFPWWLCCCLPRMLTTGVHLSFERPGYVPFACIPISTGHQQIRLQLAKDDAQRLRRALAASPACRHLAPQQAK